MNIIERLIPALGKRRAVLLARAHCAGRMEKPTEQDQGFLRIEQDTASLDDLHIWPVDDHTLTPYLFPQEPSWIISAPWFDGKDGTMIRSSRIIMVSKKSGKVLYDGSAHDEG